MFAGCCSEVHVAYSLHYNASLSVRTNCPSFSVDRHLFRVYNVRVVNVLALLKRCLCSCHLHFLPFRRAISTIIVRR